MNSALIMQANLLLSLVICGLAQYATGITAFLWLPFLLAIATLMLLPLQTRYSPLRLDYQEKVLLLLYCGLLVLALLGTLLQQGGHGDYHRFQERAGALSAAPLPVARLLP
ncbi:hypothetical protein ACK33T_09065 [Aeromonas veronii]